MSLLKLNNFFKISIIAAISLTSAYGNGCEKRVFNLKINEQVSVQEILTQLSDMCHFSVVTKDQFAKDAISEPLFGINIKDKTLNEIFSLLLSEKDMSYTFYQDILKISSLQTKTFKIDYITSVREGTAITKASVDSAPIEVGDEKQDDGEKDITKGGGKLDNVIRTVEKFDFLGKTGH